MSAIEDGAMQDKVGAQIDKRQADRSRHIDTLQPDTIKALCKKAMDDRDEADARILVLDAELTRLRERNAELEKVIAWANNSLFGSHEFFLSINGGKDNEHHLDEGIENLKQHNRDYWSRIAELEGNIKHKTELGAVLSAAHLQNRARIASLEATVRGMREALEPFRHNLFGWGVPDKVIISIRAALVSSESVVKSEGEKDGE